MFRLGGRSWVGRPKCTGFPGYNIYLGRVPFTLWRSDQTTHTPKGLLGDWVPGGVGSAFFARSSVCV